MHFNKIPYFKKHLQVLEALDNSKSMDAYVLS